MEVEGRAAVVFLCPDGSGRYPAYAGYDKDKLAIALKGANEAVRQFFFSNMSSRAAKMLTDDMANLGPVRLKDVDDAQVLLVNLTKDLAAKGELVISKQRGDEELVY
jgi:flagellar motor switch protein FliG